MGRKKWNVITDWIASDQSIVRRWSRPLPAYAKERASRRGIARRRNDRTSAYLAVSNIEVIYDHGILVLRRILQVRSARSARCSRQRRGRPPPEGHLEPAGAAERGEVTKGQIVFPRRAHRPAQCGRTGEARHLQVMEGRHCFQH